MVFLITGMDFDFGLMKVHEDNAAKGDLLTSGSSSTAEASAFPELVGYDEKMYYFNDPWEHHGTIGYPKEVVEARHRAQYEMAVTAYRA
jgi:hypothetical protein